MVGMFIHLGYSMTQFEPIKLSYIVLSFIYDWVKSDPPKLTYSYTSCVIGLVWVT